MAQPLEQLELTCPAKVNLALSVGAPLDSGMHPIASWMVAVVFGDSLVLRRRDGASSFHLAFADDAPHREAIDWPLEKDLAYRAHAALEAHVGRPLPVDATLTKRIPTGAGLGGGSSDAAGMLVGLNRLFDLGLDTAALMCLGATLGSDIPFLVAAISGQASAMVTGLGEKVEPLSLGDVIPIVLIFPGVACPTGPVYQAFDASLGDGGGKVADEPRVRKLAVMSPVPQAAPFNDLAEPAGVVQPALREARQRVERALNLPVHITGSGATMFLIAPSAITCQVLARKITAQTGLATRATRTLASRAQPPSNGM